MSISACLAYFRDLSHVLPGLLSKILLVETMRLSLELR